MEHIWVVFNQMSNRITLHKTSGLALKFIHDNYIKDATFANSDESYCGRDFTDGYMWVRADVGTIRLTKQIVNVG